jgi:hypothetical protein
MGKNDNKSIDTETTRNRGTEGPRSESTGKRGRGRPRKDGGPTGGPDTTTETDIPKLVLVNVPEIDEPDQEEKSVVPSPAKNEKKRPRKDVQMELKKDQVAVLIKTTFDILASREGSELWKLSQKECDLIADPLATILNKSPMMNGAVSKYGDVIALVVAVATVILPRLMVQLATKKKKEKVKPYVAVNENTREQADRNSGNKGRTDGNGPRKFDVVPSATGPNLSGELYGIIPAIQ